MKSIKFNLRIIFLSLISCLTFSSIASVKLLRQSNLVSLDNNTNTNTSTTNSTNTTYITPMIENSRKIKGNERSYEKVSYVKQISAGGKAALELQESGE